MLDVFPQFKTLHPDNTQEYQDFISRYPAHCDFTMNNLMVWMAGGHGVQASWLNDNIVILVRKPLYQNSIVKDHLYTVLGNTEPEATLDVLLHNERIGRLDMVPDYFVQAMFNRGDYQIEYDPSNSDYIFDINGLVEMTGGVYGEYRYRVGYFVKRYGAQVRVIYLDPGNPDDVALVLGAAVRWKRLLTLTGRAVNDPGNSDLQAIRRIFQLHGRMPIAHKVLGVFIGETLEGVSIYHVPNSAYSIAIGNHIIYNALYPKMFDYLAYVTACTLKDRNIRLLNGEQDMGIPGIRHHKQSLNPIARYKKYSISLA